MTKAIRAVSFAVVLGTLLGSALAAGGSDVTIDPGDPGTLGCPLELACSAGGVRIGFGCGTYTDPTDHSKTICCAYDQYKCNGSTYTWRDFYSVLGQCGSWDGPGTEKYCGASAVVIEPGN